jgi:hypothetical protein
MMLGNAQQEEALLLPRESATEIYRQTFVGKGEMVW